ncbi:MAG: acylphosphatase [Candidatus Pacearchaeota archaeon]|jgi:acylphosphatase
MKSVRVYISGTVQGVMFRKFIEEQANLIGVRGFVRNMDDGKVEVIIEGINEKVDKMIEACKTGNKHAQVRDVLVQEIKYQGFEGFKISKL